MFGNHFKYVLALGFLASFVYTSPAVLDSISSGIANTNQQAAVWDGWFGFGNHSQVPLQVRQDFGSTSGSADVQRPPRPFGTSTDMRPPEAPFASSTHSRGDGVNVPFGQEKKGGPMNPQDVITVLFKAGIISSDNVDKARHLFNQPPQVGSSTLQGIPVRAHFAPEGGQSSSQQ